MAEKNNSKNIERRKRRRYKKRVKTSVKLGVLAFLIIVGLSSWIGYRIYLMKTYVNPFGEVETADDYVEIDDDVEMGTITKPASYEILDLDGGEGIFLRCGNVEALIDTGNEKSTEKLMAALKGNVRGNLDYLVLTAPSAQRTGGVSAVAKEYQIGTCILGELGEAGKRKVGQDIGGKADRIIAGKSASYDFGEGVTLFVIKPDVSSSDIKDKSLVTYFKVKDIGFIAFSDAGREEVARALTGIQSCEAVVLPQHGEGDSIKKISKTVTASNFIASAAKDSGFPSAELEEMFYSRVFGTGKSGTISYLIYNDDAICSLDEDDYKVALEEISGAKKEAGAAAGESSSAADEEASSKDEEVVAPDGETAEDAG